MKSGNSIYKYCSNNVIRHMFKALVQICRQMHMKTHYLIIGFINRAIVHKSVEINGNTTHSEVRTMFHSGVCVTRYGWMQLLRRLHWSLINAIHCPGFFVRIGLAASIFHTLRLYYTYSFSASMSWMYFDCQQQIRTWVYILN